MMNTAPRRIQFHIPNLYDVRHECFSSSGTSTPQNGADSRDQFTGIERLGQVIVSADLKSHNPVHIFAASGQQQNRNSRSVSEPAENIETVQRGKHHVE